MVSPDKQLITNVHEVVDNSFIILWGFCFVFFCGGPWFLFHLLSDYSSADLLNFLQQTAFSSLRCSASHPLTHSCRESHSHDLRNRKQLETPEYYVGKKVQLWTHSHLTSHLIFCVTLKHVSVKRKHLSSFSVFNRYF